MYREDRAGSPDMAHAIHRFEMDRVSTADAAFRSHFFNIFYLLYQRRAITLLVWPSSTRLLAAWSMAGFISTRFVDL
jgi:hypothetical protein